MSLLLAWQVKEKHCLVIGSGEVALSRIEHLLRAQAKITVISGLGKLHPKIDEYSSNGKLRLEQREYRTSDLTMYENQIHIDVNSITESHYEEITNNSKYVFAVVCCCIDDYDLSTKIYYQCKYLRLPVNIADKPPLCDFYFGSMFNQDSLQIMVSTNGKSPRLLKLIKDAIAKQFKDVDLNKAVENLGAIRASLRQLVLHEDLSSINQRMDWIKTLTDFFDLRQWSQLNITPTESKKIISYFPNFPPNNFEQFKAIL